MGTAKAKEKTNAKGGAAPAVVETCTRGAVRTCAGGATLAVRVVPRASKTEWAGMQGEAAKIRLQAPPVDGKANAALCEFVAEAFGLPKRAVSVIAGQTSREKTLLLAGADAVAVGEALSAALR